MLLYFTESIFQTAGYNGNPGMPSVIIATVKVGATCFSTGLMDKIGRKLFLTGGSLMMISCLSFGFYFYLSGTFMGHTTSWLSLACLILYVAAFSLGWASIPWLILFEISLTGARGKAAALATGLNWTCHSRVHVHANCHHFSANILVFRWYMFYGNCIDVFLFAGN